MEQLVVCDGAGHVDGSAWHLLRPKHAAARPELLALPFSDRVPRPQQLQAGDRRALNGSNLCQCKFSCVSFRRKLSPLEYKSQRVLRSLGVWHAMFVACFFRKKSLNAFDV